MNKKQYIIILDVGNGYNKKEVIHVLETDTSDEDNMWDVAKILYSKWNDVSKKYPPPRYDIVIGSWDNIKVAENSIINSFGWESAPIERLQTSI